ncbi:hypothetical protein Rmet_3347 [Cupriavidus metallidurans CH34]|uniref:PD-(D/E)XK nuclease superfamily protein n=2 Tax=Cupriavidus metallidurans TaxID=119219 RepID=Q1LI07_CUPMC|nr:hypothetical protein Rmet_3347 [Cupriavidus metallidurans CH34]QGS28991.1 hypothetical protein FOB83_08830 [Cupriavidus metallidurans]
MGFVEQGQGQLDLLTPRENQHSDLLAWCFNAREGHGQGDAILKDFLVALYGAASDVEPGDRVAGKGLSRDFIRQWTPARVLTTSFATAFCYREYTLPRIDGDGGARRLDLLVVDQANRLLIVVENKAGTRFRTGQLEGYLESVQRTLLTRPAFREFSVVFVALDRDYLVNDDDESGAQDFDRRWVRLNYEWLKPAGKRAEFSVERGNQSAALLLSYCRRQTGWESESMKIVTKLAVDIAVRYPTLVKQFADVAKELGQPESWTPTLMSPDSVEGQLLRFYRQYESAVDSLLDLTPLQRLHTKLAEEFSTLDNDWEVHEYARVRAAYQLPSDQSMPKTDGAWPLYLYIRHINPDTNGTSMFRVMLCWRPWLIPEDARQRVCDALAKVYPAVASTVDRTKTRWLEREECSFDRAVALGAEIVRKIDGELGGARY